MDDPDFKKYQVLRNAWIAAENALLKKQTDRENRNAKATRNKAKKAYQDYVAGLGNEYLEACNSLWKVLDGSAEKD